MCASSRGVRARRLVFVLAGCALIYRCANLVPHRAMLVAVAVSGLSCCALIRLGAWVNVLMSVFPPPPGGQPNNVTLSSRGGAPVALTLWRCKRLPCRQLHSANTVSDVWLLRRHRAHERLRAFRVPRLIRRVAAIIRRCADMVHRRAMLLAAAVSGRGCILECRAPCAYWSAL